MFLQSGQFLVYKTEALSSYYWLITNFFMFSECDFSTLNPFVPNATFLYSLKTSENRNGVEKECIGNEWVKLLNH